MSGDTDRRWSLRTANLRSYILGMFELAHMTEPTLPP